MTGFACRVGVRRWLIACAVLIGVPVGVSADTITLKADGTGDFATIQAAIDDAGTQDGDVIELQQGTYTGSGNRDVDFGGKGITVCSTDPDDPDVVSATIIDCGGTASSPHRAFYLDDWQEDDCVISGLTIINGYAPSEQAYSSKSAGGAIFVDSADSTITQCILRNNFAGDDGGAIFCNTGNPTIQDCRLLNNLGVDYGGGICCYFGEPSVTHCVLLGNRAQNGGGIFSYSHMAPAISKCVLAGNVASILGGGFACGGNSSITNCIISGNLAAYGGGLCCYYGNATITNVTIVGNTAKGFGGGIYVVGDCSTTLTNSVLWDNEACYGAQIGLQFDGMSTSTLTVAYCDIEGGQSNVYKHQYSTLNWGNGNIDSAPDFAFQDDYHLSSGSPCIDTGTNSPSGGLPGTDIDGNTRPLDGDGTSGAVADMGAYEYNNSVSSIALSAFTLEFFASEGGDDPNDQTLSIANCGSGTLSWQISEECSWLSVSPSSGSSTGEADDVTVSVTVNGLQHGRHFSVLEVSASGAANTSRLVFVTVHISGTLNVPSAYSAGVAEGAREGEAALDAAVDGDDIVLAQQTYSGDGNRDLDFLGKAVTLRSADPNDPQVVAGTVIDCDGTSANRHRAASVQFGEDSNTVLDGLTITDGYAPAANLEANGGAVFIFTASPTIRNCVFTSCTAEGYSAGRGGAIYSAFGDPTISHCTIGGQTSGNSAVSSAGFAHGGGVCIHGLGDQVTIEYCDITYNTANGGGGIAVHGHATVDHCTIDHNEAINNGGGIWVEADPDGYSAGAGVTVSDSDVTNNTSGSDGGGMKIEQSEYDPSPQDSSITSCHISGNTANIEGGGLYVDAANCTVSNCQITDNSAWRYGGLYLGYVEGCAISHSEISDNEATHEAGGVGALQTSTFTDCHIESNSAGSYGGGLYLWGDVDVTFVLEKCAVVGNIADGCGAGAYCEDCVAEFSECEFVSNGDETTTVGGGIYLFNVYGASISDSVIAGNQADDGGGLYHGGLYAEDLTITRCRFVGNKAVDGHGGGLRSVGPTDIFSSLFVANNANNGAGGGLHCNFAGDLTVWSTLVAGNQAQYGGGGIIACTTNAELVGCTIVDNEADSYGGGFDSTVSSTAYLRNSVIWGNDSGDQGADQIYDGGGALYVQYCDVQGAWTGSGNINQYPKFAIDKFGDDEAWSSAGSYSSTTFQTTLTDDDADWVDHALIGLVINPDVTQNLQFVVVDNTATEIRVWGDASSIAGTGDEYALANYNLTTLQDGTGQSPCIDAGYDSYAEGDYDIEGDARIVGDHVDMGADEYTPYDARLADPWFDGTIPKTQNNIVWLPFNIYGEVSLPAQGPALTITRLDTSGDVSTDFDYSVVSSKSPNDTLKVKEDGQKLTDQTWYRCEPDPDLDVPEDFDLDVCTLRGDALDSDRVTTADYSPVKAHLGERTDKRYDLDGTGRVTTADYSVVKANLGNRKPAKP